VAVEGPAPGNDRRRGKKYRRVRFFEGMMAWSGKPTSRDKRRASLASRRLMRPLPPRENPLGVPRAVMKELAAENLESDPVVWNARLQELLQEHKGD